MDKMMHAAKIQSKPMPRSEAFKILNIKEDAEEIDPEDVMTVKQNTLSNEFLYSLFSAT